MELIRGNIYPLPIKTQEGASAQFLLKEGSFLQIVLPSMDAQEEKALRNGLCKVGILANNGAILFVFQFLDNQGHPVISLDCPFDARIIPKESLFLPDITKPLERLLFEVHGIDENKILRCLRGLTLSPKSTLDLFAAVQDQLASTNQQAEAIAMSKWAALEPFQLALLHDMEICGR
jgi:hypothetical protein